MRDLVKHRPAHLIAQRVAAKEIALKRLLKDRDVIMTDYIAATLKEAPGSMHFFAAGAGHYCGEDSVPALLEKKGYKVTRIEE